MPTLIDRHGVREDRWVVAHGEPAAAGGRAHASGEAPAGRAHAGDPSQPAPADGDAPPLAPGTAVLVPAHAWLAQRAYWQRHDGPLGVLLSPHDDPAMIAADLPRLALVAVTFPSFTDGRGYSIARLLRERHGWRGPLRAVGDVQRDQLFLLARCGFDGFALRDDQDADEALTAFDDFTEVYQAAADRRALFERRPASAAVEAHTAGATRADAHRSGGADAVSSAAWTSARTTPAQPGRAPAPSKSSSPS